MSGGFLSAMPLGGVNPAMWSGYEPLSPAPQISPIQPMNTFMPSLQQGVGGQQNGGWMGIQGLGANLDTLKFGIQGLGTLAGLWNGFQQNKLARESFNHQKGLLDTNLANQIKAYNLSVDDKFRSRAVVESMSDAERDAAIARNQATDQRRR